MDFSEALVALKDWKQVKRAKWLVDEFLTMGDIDRPIWGNNHEIIWPGPCIFKKNKPWRLNMNDIMATDWQIIKQPKK